MRRFAVLLLITCNAFLSFAQDDSHLYALLDSIELCCGHSLQKWTSIEPELVYRDSIFFNGVTLFFEHDANSFQKCPVYVKSNPDSLIMYRINMPQPHFFRSNFTALDVKTDAEIDELDGTYEEVDSLAYDERFVYQDEYYHVSQTNAGEWGSIIYFYDLKSGFRKECGGMGRFWISMYRIGGKYIMSSERTIVEYDPPQMIRSEGVRDRRPLHTSDDGSKVLFKQSWNGLKFYASFVNQDTIYYVYNDGNQYAVGFLKDGEIKRVATVSDSYGFNDDRISCLSIDENTLVVAIRQPMASKGYSSLWVFRGDSWQVLNM